MNLLSPSSPARLDLPNWIVLAPLTRSRVPERRLRKGVAEVSIVNGGHDAGVVNDDVARAETDLGV